MPMASTPAVFLAVACVVGVGFVSARLASATRFPDVATLLLLGLALGPLNRLLVTYGWGIPSLAEALDPDLLRQAAPLVSGLALVVILFEAGLSMDMTLVRRSLGPALRISLPVFVVTSLAIAAVGHWVYGMPSLVAAALGVSLSNVGQTVSSALLRRMRLDERTRAVGLVEMAIYDIISVPILVSIFLFAGGESSGTAAWSLGLQGFAQIASISFVLGAGAGLTWVFALRRLADHPHSYMLTLAALLSVYAITEELGGAGAVSVLLFGLCIGNRHGLLRLMVRGAPQPGEGTKVQDFHEEVTFLVRTLFFLFLGLSFAVGLADQWPVSSPLPWLASLEHRAALFGLGAAIVLVILPLARAAVIPLMAGRQRDLHGLIPVFGHGLGTAVLATLPFVWQEFRPGTAFHDAFAPWQPVFVNLAFLVILASVLGSGLLVFLAERTRPGAPAEPISRRPGRTR